MMQKPTTNCITFIAGCSLHQSRAQQPFSTSPHGTFIPSGETERKIDEFVSEGQMWVFSLFGRGMKNTFPTIIEQTPKTRIKNRSSILEKNKNVKSFLILDMIMVGIIICCST